MGGHGHGHGPPYVIPDPNIYKVENVPELKAVQEKLAEKGLKDPWLRNEVWRFTEPKVRRVRTFNYLFRGLKLGVPLFLMTIGIEYALGIDYHHGSHDDHGSHGHH